MGRLCGVWVCEPGGSRKPARDRETPMQRPANDNRRHGRPGRLLALATYAALVAILLSALMIWFL